MTPSLHWILIIIAVVLLAVAAWTGNSRIGWLGMFFWVVSEVVK